MCAFAIFVEHCSFRGAWLDRFMLQPTVMPDYIVSNFKSFCKLRKLKSNKQFCEKEFSNEHEVIEKIFVFENYSLLLSNCKQFEKGIY